MAETEAEAEAVVNTELVVCEGEDASVSVNGREHEASEETDEVTLETSIEIAELQDLPDKKRKVEDMEPFNNDESPAKKQKICASEASTEGADSTTDQVTLTSEVSEPEIGTQQTESPGHQITEKPASVADGMMPNSAEAIPAINGDVEQQFQQDEKPNGIGHPITEKPKSVVDDMIPSSVEAIQAINGDLEQQFHQDEKPNGIGPVHMNVEEQSFGNGQVVYSEDIQHTSADDTQHPSSAYSQDISMHKTPYDVSSSAHKINVPNDKVGVLIGKYGETIKYLQLNSGAKIQITRDTDVDPYSSTRVVELIGTLECVNKAEQLIKNVIAEADAGGSPALVARGFGALQSGDEQDEVQVPNEKVGVIIGKGGETIKNIQTRSGARLQLIPQHLPKGDVSKERTVRITGSNKQVESAKEMIKDIMNQLPSRHSGTYRPPRGPGPATHWGPRSAAPTQQTTSYSHQQRGMYPPTQYSQPYGGYSQQPPPGDPYGSSWVQQRPAAPMQASPQPGGYDYYNQGGPVHNNQSPNPVPGSGPSSAPTTTNYNYYQSQPPDAYGHSSPYPQTQPSQQKYGYGYSNEPKYDTQQTGQQMYAQQQPMGPQPGMYAPQSTTPYGQPAYAAAPHDVTRMTQPVDQMYQGVPQNQYPSSTPMQQQYPYASNTPSQQAPPYIQQAYGPTSAPVDGYSQQSAAGYAQQVQPATGYVQGGQAAPAYGQPVPQSGGYSQYPTQPNYGDQTAQSNMNYGYQGAAPDAAYAGSVASSGYTAQQPVASQAVYSQPPANPSGYYDQSIPPQSGYAAPAAAPATAQVAYAKSVSPQPGYAGGQYDSGQTYANY